MNAWRRAATLLTVTGIVTCWAVSAGQGSEAGTDGRAKLEAIEAAHKAGILSDKEYGRKKAEAEAQLRAATSPHVRAIRQKLQALEMAHRAGILSGGEYGRKKTELETQLRAATAPRSEATRKKLQALETAHQAGILSDAEYARKKRELLAASQATAPLDEAARLTLQALKAAHSAGILSDEEYARKKGELEGRLQSAIAPIDKAARRVLQALEVARQTGILSDEDCARKTAELQAHSQNVTAPLDRAARVLKALEAAHQAGVMDDDQFGREKADVEGRVQAVKTPLGKATQGILQALAVARQTGILDDTKLGRKSAGADSQIRAVEDPLDKAIRMLQTAQAIAPMVIPGHQKRGGTAPSTTAAARPSAEGGRALQALEAARQAGVVGESEYQRKKAALAGPRGNGGAAAPTGRKGKTYQHPAGLTFRCPDGWTVEQHEEFLQLVPPNPAWTAEGPAELYFVIAENVAEEGVQRPDDPRVVAYLGTQIRSLAPTVQRVGQTSFIETSGGRGAVLDWEGKSPQGTTVRARGFVSIANGHALALVGIGFEDRLAARDSHMRQVFASFAFGTGPGGP